MHADRSALRAALKPGEASDELRAVEEYEPRGEAERSGDMARLRRSRGPKIEIVRDVFDAVRGSKRIWGYGAPARRRCGECKPAWTISRRWSMRRRSGRKAHAGDAHADRLPGRDAEEPPDIVFITAGTNADTSS